MPENDHAAEELLWVLRDLKKPYPCNRCSGHCCQEYDVEVMDDDAEAIADWLGLTPGEVKERYFNPTPVRELGGEPVYEIKKLPDGWCPFSEVVAGKKRICGIYFVRPDSCRDFSAFTCEIRKQIL